MPGEANPLQISRCVQLHHEAATQRGLKLFIGYDFREYVSITRVTPTKGPTFPNFRPDRSPIKSGEGFWMVAIDNNGKVAVLQAARLYDLSHSNLAEHLRSLKAFYADPTIHAHPEDSCICSAASAKKITGKVAYSGDLWVRRDFRGRGIPKILATITRRVMFAMWAPDFSCALVQRWTLDKGVYETAHQEPGGAKLQLVEEGILEDNWLTWRTGEELRELMDHSDQSETIFSS